MEATLFINLKRNGDIFSMGQIIGKYKEKNPNHKIHVLVYQEFIKSALCLNNIDQIFTIDRKKVIMYKNNKLFSNAYSINSFTDVISGLKKFHYNHIVNYSNSKLAAYLIPYLSPDTYSGIRMNESLKVSYSNEYALIFNEIQTISKIPSLPFYTNYLKILDLNTDKQDSSKIFKFNPLNDEKAQKNISIIRNSLEMNGSSKIKLVAIQLNASQVEKEIPYDSLISFIKFCLNSSDIFPLLIFAPTPQEREKIESLNKVFNNKLLSIEADFSSLGSVFRYIDLLITPDTAVKHIADIIDLPVLEVSLGPAPTFKQGTINPASLIVTNTRKSKSKFPTHSITGRDLFVLSNCILQKRPYHEIKISEELTVYRPKYLSWGLYYEPCIGQLNPDLELSRLINQYLIFNIIENYKIDDFLDLAAKICSKDEIISWINNEKTYVERAVSILLKSLRSLRKMNKQKTQVTDFILSIEKFLSLSESEFLVATPCLIFRAKLDNLSIDNFNQNKDEVERILFELKSDLQSYTKILTELSGHLNYKRTAPLYTPAPSV